MTILYTNDRKDLPISNTTGLLPDFLKCGLPEAGVARPPNIDRSVKIKRFLSNFPDQDPAVTEVAKALPKERSYKKEEVLKHGNLKEKISSHNKIQE